MLKSKEKQIRIELLGRYEEPVGDYAPGEKYSHIQYVSKEYLLDYGTVENCIHCSFDHNVLDEMEGYRVYDENNKLYDLSDDCTLKTIEKISTISCIEEHLQNNAHKVLMFDYEQMFNEFCLEFDLDEEDCDEDIKDSFYLELCDLRLKTRREFKKYAA
tara:strand:+ start:64 stop:540 length:477 start_codon:yes stop_codon:yes gene_type:complete